MVDGELLPFRMRAHLNSLPFLPQIVGYVCLGLSALLAAINS